jgi:hypothetical protein
MDSQISVHFPVTSVLRCTVTNAKTTGLTNLHHSDMDESSGPPDGARIVHHELLIVKEPFLLDKPLLFRTGPNTSRLWEAFFLTWSMRDNQVTSSLPLPPQPVLQAYFTLNTSR